MIWLLAAVCILGPVWVLLSMIRENPDHPLIHPEGDHDDKEISAALTAWDSYWDVHWESDESYHETSKSAMRAALRAASEAGGA